MSYGMVLGGVAALAMTATITVVAVKMDDHLPARVGPSRPPTAVEPAPETPEYTPVPGLPGVASACDHGHRVYEVIDTGIGHGQLAVATDDWGCGK